MSCDLRHLTSTNQVPHCGQRRYTTVLNCPNYERECAPDLQKGYRAGPEMSFIGSRYGDGDSPKILFTRVNPLWKEEAKTFGTRESIETMFRVDPPTSLDRVFDCLRDFWKDSSCGTLYQGCNCCKTVAGKGNHPIGDMEEYFSRPLRYGIKMILCWMQRAKLISPDLDDVLDCCAINNLVKCSAGKKRKADKPGKPTRGMKVMCRPYFREELRILRPKVVISLGEEARANDVLVRTNDVRFHENLPHPALRPGPWRKQHRPDPGISWSSEAEKKQYKRCLALKGLVDNLVNRLGNTLASRKPVISQGAHPLGRPSSQLAAGLPNPNLRVRVAQGRDDKSTEASKEELTIKEGGTSRKIGTTGKIYGFPLKDVIDDTIAVVVSIKGITDATAQTVTMVKSVLTQERIIEILGRKLPDWRDLTSSEKKEEYIKKKTGYRIEKHLRRIFVELGKR